MTPASIARLAWNSVGQTPDEVIMAALGYDRMPLYTQDPEALWKYRDAVDAYCRIYREHEGEAKRCQHCGGEIATRFKCELGTRRFCSNECHAQAKRVGLHERNMAIVQAVIRGERHGDVGEAFGLSRSQVSYIWGQWCQGTAWAANVERTGWRREQKEAA